ncbi:MAG TPA: hypothetical protein VHB45_12180 [Alloacidobacterium sp.]|nr:hypothetical protein [Alloacidobacterium sp.]
MNRKKAILFVFAVIWFAATAHADIGVVIADPTTIGSSAYTHAGHSLIYLSGVCPDTPVHARLCKAGEQGSIVTAYPDFKEWKPYAWNMAPLSIYLNGLSSPDNRLLYASRKVEAALDDSARNHYLKPVCEGRCPDMQHAYWHDMIAATADRDIFIYAVRSTHAQDQAIVDWLNADANVNHYNGVTRNCAVFTRELVNLIFPHAVHRDFLNDLGMMSPKAAARSFSRWATKHPELGFYSMHFAQQPGDLPRAGMACNGTEAAIHIKKYLIPAAMIGDHEVAGSFFVAYFLTGRFDLYKEYRRYPAPTVVSIESEARRAKDQANERQWRVLRTSLDEIRSEKTGTPESWAAYRERVREFQAFASANDIPQEKKKKLPSELADAPVAIDEDGNPWLILGTETGQQRVGASSANLLAGGSNPRLAFELILGRVSYVLEAKNHLQEDFAAFREDWSLLQAAYDRLHRAPAAEDWPVVASTK